MQLVFDHPIAGVRSTEFSWHESKCDCMLVMNNRVESYLVSMNFEDVLSVALYQLGAPVMVEDKLTFPDISSVVTSDMLESWCMYADTYARYFLIEQREYALLKRPIDVHWMLKCSRHPIITDTMFKCMLFWISEHLLPEIYLSISVQMLELLRVTDEYVVSARVPMTKSETDDGNL